MNLPALKRASTLVVLWSTVLYIGVLLLDWRRVSVEVAGVVDVEQTSSGLSNWGVVAGVIAVALVVLTLARIRGDTPATPRRLLAELILAVGLLVFTVVAMFTGDVNVSAGPVGIEVETTLWPAWVGLFLAAVIVVAAAVEAAPEVSSPAHPRLGGPQPHP
jgi:hypothetical protein